MILVILVFLMIGESKKEKTQTWSAIDQSVRKYINTKILIAIVTATLFGITYWLLNLELALIFASLIIFLAFFSEPL